MKCCVGEKCILRSNLVSGRSSTGEFPHYLAKASNQHLSEISSLRLPGGSSTLCLSSTINIIRKMVSLRASRSRVDMGQTSSQPQPPPPEQSATKSQRKSKVKKGKSKKSKRKSAEMERPIDQEEEESARTLMEISKAPIQQGRTSYYENEHALSPQLMIKSSPIHSSSAAEPIRKSKSCKANDKREVKKQSQTDIYELSGSEERSNGAQQHPDIPSTPPAQVDRSSPSPYRPNIALVNALDDISTDDDAVAAYEEYAKDTTSPDPPDLPDRDIYNFSQQPPNPFDQEEIGSAMHIPNSLPTNGCVLSPSAEKQKKKRKRMDRQEKLAHERGQYIPPREINGFLEFHTSSADLFRLHEGDKMPIDPELHSIDALASSANLWDLKNESLDTVQKNGKSSSRHGSSQPRKRRRLEVLPGPKTADLPYMSPYSFQHDQENIKDQVLPGYEDLQRQSSHGLGSPFTDDAVERNPEHSGDGVQNNKSIKRKSKGERVTARPKKEREGSEEDDKIERAKEDKAENGGAFSTVEALKLDAFRNNHCEANDMSIWQFNSLIQSPMRGNAQVTALFNEIHDILPYRPRISVQKFCKRRFHNFSRGSWDAAEDEMLKLAVAEKGKAWKRIGDSLGRMPEDCRDRWRNYIVNSEHRNREQWTAAEVMNLCTAIIECMQLMKEDRKRAREEGEDMPASESDQELEDMKNTNWQAVSDRMGEHGGGRSRLQCSFKWGQLKKREQADYLKAILESRDIEKKEYTPAKNPWRMKMASKKVANMKPGDIHAFLQAVVDSNVPEEGNIPWKSLGDHEFRSTWTATDKKVAWSRLKRKVPGSESMDFRSVVNELLSQVIDQGEDALNERWDPELHGDVSEKKNGKKRKKYTRRTTTGKGKEEIDPTNLHLQRSKEFDDDSEDMHGNVEGQARSGAIEPQGYNRYHALSMADDIDGEMTADDQNDIFNDRRNANGHPPMADGELSPEFAGRLQSALNAYN